MTRLLVTGTTSGIGYATAESIAATASDASPKHLIMAVRNTTLAHEQRHKLCLKYPSAEIDVVECRLESRSSIERCAETVIKRFGELDVLINNAGAMFQKPRLAESGFELTFATNHLGPFHLTNLLLPALIHDRVARVVNVASKQHFKASLNFERLTQTSNYSMMSAYGCSKLANVMFSNALARRVESSNVRVNALHPGVINSNILPARRGWPLLRRTASVLGIMKSPKEGAATALYLALSPSAQDMQGLYLNEHQVPEPCSAEAMQVARQERLWKLSETACGIDHPVYNRLQPA